MPAISNIGGWSTGMSCKAIRDVRSALKQSPIEVLTWPTAAQLQ